MKAYLFDLDGTLADSRAGLYPAFRAGLQTIGAASVGDEQLAAFLGTPLPEMFRAFRPEIAQAEIDAGMAAFRTAYEITGIVDSELYPGVIRMLAGIRQRGSAVWVVTSKPEPQAVRVAAHLKLDAYVAGVVGASLAETDTKTELVARGDFDGAMDPWPAPTAALSSGSPSWRCGANSFSSRPSVAICRHNIRRQRTRRHRQKPATRWH